MKQPIVFQPERRLANILRRSGGIEVGQAVGRATARLETVRESSLVAIDETIAALAAALETAVPPSRLYVLSTEIFGLAGAFALDELANAAASLSEILEAAGKGADASTEVGSNPKLGQAVQVHVAALRLLRRMNADGDASSRQAIVAGLRDVSLRMAKA